MGSTVSAADRSRRVGGSSRRPATSSARPAGGRVLELRGEQEHERLAGHGIGLQRGQQLLEVAPGDRGTLGDLERAEVHDHPHARRPGGCGRGPGAPARPSRRDHGPGRTGPRPRSSSQRSRSTTNSASTRIRRLILDWPTRRSRNVIGTSTTRAPSATGAVGHLDLEHVPTRPDTVERHRREGRRSPRLEPAGQVVGAQAQDESREQRPAARDHPPHDPPVHHAAAGRVARPDHQVRPVGHDRLHQGRQRTGIVRPVGIHLDDHRRAPVQGLAEAVEVGAAEALLRGAVPDPDPPVLGREPVGELAGAVRRAIVDDQQAPHPGAPRGSPRRCRAGSRPRCRWAARPRRRSPGRPPSWAGWWSSAVSVRGHGRARGWTGRPVGQEATLTWTDVAFRWPPASRALIRTVAVPAAPRRTVNTAR